MSNGNTPSINIKHRIMYNLRHKNPRSKNISFNLSKTKNSANLNVDCQQDKPQVNKKPRFTLAYIYKKNPTPCLITRGKAKTGQSLLLKFPRNITKYILIHIDK